jgi:hypothetical protein
LLILKRARTDLRTGQINQHCQRPINFFGCRACRRNVRRFLVVRPVGHVDANAVDTGSQHGVDYARLSRRWAKRGKNFCSSHESFPDQSNLKLLVEIEYNPARAASTNRGQFLPFQHLKPGNANSPESGQLNVCWRHAKSTMAPENSLLPQLQLEARMPIVDASGRLPTRTYNPCSSPDRKVDAMPELIRSVVSRVRTYLKDRRQSPRLRVRILLSISVRQKATSNGAPSSSRTLKGYTRDISIKGLAMVLPQVHLAGYHLAAEGRELHVILELPDGSISMMVLPRRYEMLDDAELGCNYLIGARIVDVSDDDRLRLESFIAQGIKGRPAQGSDSPED